jgi:hypothetical protein
MTSLNASFTGKLINDSTIDGSFTQGGEFPLLLKKTEKVTEKKRPQTPKPPFAYKSEDVEYNNADNSLAYGATITIPEGKGPFPAAVLITEWMTVALGKVLGNSASLPVKILRKM